MDLILTWAAAIIVFCIIALGLIIFAGIALQSFNNKKEK